MCKCFYFLFHLAIENSLLRIDVNSISSLKTINELNPNIFNNILSTHQRNKKKSYFLEDYFSLKIIIIMPSTSITCMHAFIPLRASESKINEGAPPSLQLPTLLCL